jgi:hypothetical protein
VQVSSCAGQKTLSNARAPRGNQNALTHGRFTREFIEERRRTYALIRTLRGSINSVVKRKG